MWRKSLLCLLLLAYVVLSSTSLYAISYSTTGDGSKETRLTIDYEDGMTYTFRLVIDRGDNDHEPTIRWVFEKMEKTVSSGWSSGGWTLQYGD